MHKPITDKELAERQAKGAQVETRPKKVEGKVTIEGLADMVEQMAKAQREASAAQHKALITAIDKLASAIKSKQSKDLDLAPLIEAVAGLKQEATAVSEPTDYIVTGERDQRQLIDLSKGLRFTAVRPTIN